MPLSRLKRLLASSSHLLDRSGSSLIDMAEYFISISNHSESGFFVKGIDELKYRLENLDLNRVPTILLGVTFALMDLAESIKNPMNLNHTIIMETGGMKGKRKEMLKEELHEILKDDFGLNHIQSDFGMTELLSQSYSKKDGVFLSPSWMDILIRDINDPLSILGFNKLGGVNIIDLANLNSCSFIATDDLGIKLNQNEFKINGSREASYTPIVAGGKRACVLHYIDNDQNIKDGELVLVDAGCEYGMYASDITRTYPINGKFTGEQRAIYDVVLEAHNAACHAAKVGNPCTDPQKTSEKSLSQGLKDIGLLKGSLDEILEKNLYREFYYHKIGHWMGLDVHDDCPYSIDGKEILFEDDMVMTIEPGIYVNDTADVDARWKGIGVRIENDILVKSDGYENLTVKVPVQADEIEQLMSE